MSYLMMALERDSLSYGCHHEFVLWPRVLGGGK